MVCLAIDMSGLLDYCKFLQTRGRAKSPVQCARYGGYDLLSCEEQLYLDPLALKLCTSGTILIVVKTSQVVGLYITSTIYD